MHLNEEGYVSVGQLAVYTPALLLSILVCIRHGFSRTSGYVYIVVLCVVRIAGAVCQILTYSHPTSGLITAVIVLDTIGISPLLLATLGMLSRL